MIDSLRVQQVLINLIQNSIKFSQPNDLIKLQIVRSKLKVEENEGQEFEFLIKITDQGIGISESDRKNLFKPYF